MRAIYFDKHIPRVLMTKAIAPIWKDFIWTPLSAVRAGSLDDMTLPGSRWIRVKNEACGICATDLSLLYAKTDVSVAPAALPGIQRFYLGHESVGIVTEAGAGVTNVKVGDRVIMENHFYGANCLNVEVEHPCEKCQTGETNLCLNKSDYKYLGIGGGFGDEYIAHETGVVRAPEDLTLELAALVEPIGISTHAVLRHPPKESSKVLVIGMGMIGLSTLMAVKAIRPECEVSVISRYDFQSQMAEKLGAKTILTPKDGYPEIAKAAGGKFFSAPMNKGAVVGGFDIIYDCVGNEETINNSLRWTKAGGKVVMIGAAMRPMKRVDLVTLWYSKLEFVGVVAHGHENYDDQHKHTYDWVFEFMREGKIQTDGLITHRFPYDDYRQALKLAAGSKGNPKAIKVIMQA
ncbi:MAG TPA: alcohol dehydrogenase catalytic domain-containing protein [Anaerolineales bacterium]|nr:alcohol dehydrogenase catalytic domain-containing protein [Anaerolineales bacterium]